MLWHSKSLQSITWHHIGWEDYYQCQLCKLSEGESNSSLEGTTTQHSPEKTEENHNPQSRI